MISDQKHRTIKCRVAVQMTLPTTVNMCVILTQSAEGKEVLIAHTAWARGRERKSASVIGAPHELDLERSMSTRINVLA